MKRWLLTGVLASVAWVGSASGQTARPAAPVSPPAAPATDGRSGDGVIVMKTAGQPERRVKVLRSEQLPDGTVLTEVKDLATGDVFTINGAPPAGRSDTPAQRQPTPAPAGRSDALAPRPTVGRSDVPAPRQPAPAPQPQRPQSGPSPVAMERPATAPVPAPPPESRPAPVGRVYAQPPARYTPPAAVAAPAQSPAVQAASLSVQQPAASEEQMRREVAQYVEDLRAHSRPSFRMEAATGLTESRYGSRDEIKQVLATAAKDDMAGVVRGHCIACLSKLGYADPEYVRRLGLWANDPEPAVQREARAALMKLAPRQ